MPTILKNLRLEGKSADFLSRITSDPGVIYFNRDNSTLTIFDGETQGGIELLKSDLSNLEGQISSVISSATVPSGVDPGTIWYNTNNGKIFIFYNDGDSQQWVEPTVPSIGAGTVNVSGVTSFSQLTGSIALSQIPNSLITPAKLNLNSSLIPSNNEQFDLGSSSFRWRDLYLSGSSINLGSAVITASGNSIVLPAGSTIAGSAAVNSFSTISISGQSNLVADSATDTLTLVAGPGIQLTTNETNDSITITNTGGGGGGGPSGVSSGEINRLAYYAATGSIVQDTGSNLTWNGSNLNITGTITASGAISYTRAYFETLAALTAVSPVTWHGMVAHVHETGRIYFAHAGTWVPVANQSDIVGAQSSFGTLAVAGQSNVVADQSNDTLTLIAGTNITITTNATNDSVTISASGGGSSTLAALTDVNFTIPPTNGQVLKYNSAQSQWFPASDLQGAGGDLDDLSNVVITSPSSGQVLKYNGTNWVNDTDATSGGGSFTFSTIAVAGQSNIIADTSSDTLTLAAGSNITITTDATTDTVTITASGGGSSNSFETIAVAGQASVVADSSTDTLTLVAGAGIVINTIAGNDTIAITNGITNFTNLTDVTSTAMTIDQAYLSAITRLVVTANGSASYSFDQYGAATNPTIYAISGTTIAFNLNAIAGHPFLIQTSGGANYNTGLVHVDTNGGVNSGSLAQGKFSGTLYWKIPYNTTGNYRYQCSIHGAMQGTINIRDIATI